jgi:hypothetical protein
MLEIGPGDYTMTAIFQNFGAEVHTVDIGDDPRTTFRGDIRAPEVVRQLSSDYEVILASEVLEHMDFSYLPGILATFRDHLAPGGHVVIGLPYDTMKWPYRPSRPLFRGGVIQSGIPKQALFDLLAPARVLWRKLRGKPIDLRYFPPGGYADYDRHHWDLGHRPTRPKEVRRVMEQVFDVVLFHHNRRAGSGYFVLRKR